MNPISISEKMMFNTVRLETNNGTGTGFFYSFHVGKYEHLTIITNKHVINDNPKEIVKFSLHLADDDGGSTKNISIQMESNWYFHPSKDLCFAFVQPIFKQVEEMTGKKVFYRTNGAEILATEEQLQNLSALEELVMVGYPIGMYDRKNNFPIFRKGYTAAHPAIDFNEEGIGLADIACFPGSSGSPIYILNEGSFFDKQGTVHLAKTRLLLLGILFAGPQYDAQGDIQIRAIPTSTKVVGISNTRIMANLGYYVKAHELNEFQKMIEQIVSAH